MFFVLFCFSLLTFMLHVSDHISSHTVMVRWHLYIYILHPITSFLQPEHWWKWLKSVSSFTFFFIIIISKSVSGESQPSLPFRVYWSFRACATENTVWASVQVIHDVWKSGSSKHFSSNVLEALRAVLTHTGSVLRWVSYPSSRYQTRWVTDSKVIRFQETDRGRPNRLDAWRSWWGDWSIRIEVLVWSLLRASDLYRCLTRQFQSGWHVPKSSKACHLKIYRVILLFFT